MTTLDKFMSLPADIRSTFDNITSGTGLTAFDWFVAEIPASVHDNADAIRVLLDGGTATVSRVVGGRGVGGGEYIESETIEFPDRDFSRHVSGHNGGEYTPDNVTLESASVNRSRGADNMTTDEIETAQSALETDASILADAEIITPAGETVMASNIVDVPAPVELPNDVVVHATESGGSVLGEIGESVLDGLLPATIGFTMGKHVADQFDDDVDKWGYGSMAAGGTVLACMTPPGQIALAGYAAWNIAKLAHRGIKWINAQ